HHRGSEGPRCLTQFRPASQNGAPASPIRRGGVSFRRCHNERAGDHVQGATIINRITTRRRFASTAGLLVAVLAAGPRRALAEDSPARRARVTPDWPRGRGVDVILRVVADRLTRLWGQQVLPVNQPGGGGALAARAAATAMPDGYTLAIPALSAFVALPGMAPN